MAALGYLIRGSHQIYFAGDTDLFEGMATLAPRLDLVLPIWGWGPGSALATSIRTAPPRRSGSSGRAWLSRSTGEPTRPRLRTFADRYAY